MDSEVAAVCSVRVARVSWLAKQTHPGEEHRFFAQSHYLVGCRLGKTVLCFLVVGLC